MKIFRISDFVMAAAWLLAFIFSLPLIEPAPLSRLGAIICMAVFAGAGLGRELAGPGIPAPRTPLFWILPLLWLLALASVSWSPAPMESFIAFATLGLAVSGFVVFATSRGIFRMLILLAPALFLILTLLSGWAVLQRFFLPDMLVNHGVRHPFANPNNYASLLMLGFFPAFGLLLSAVRPNVSLAAFAVSAILLAGIVAIGGLTVMALTAAGFAFMVFVCRGRTGPQRKKLLAVAAIGLLVWGLQYINPANRQFAGFSASQRMESFSIEKDASWETRLSIWSSTMAMIRDHALTGTGYGTYYLFYPQYRLPSDGASSGMMAHNDLLQSWAEMGIAAPLLLLAFFGLAAWRMAKLLRCRPPQSGERALCCALFAGAGLVAVNSLVNFDLYTACILCLLGPVLGLWLRYTALALGEPVTLVRLPGSLPPMAGWAAFILPLALLVFASQGFLRSEYHSDQAKKEALAGDWRAFDTQVNLAIGTSFDRNAQPYVLAAGIPVGILQQGDKLAAPVKVELARQAYRLLDQAEARNPRLAAVYYNRAIVAMNGPGEDKDESRRSLERALALSPGYMAPRMMLADLQYKEGNGKAALETLAAGLDRPPVAQNPESFYLMAASIALKQRNKDIREKATARLAAWKAMSTGD